MADSLLQLPRELYLECCAHLQQTDLANLSRVSKHHYLAVQAPLFDHVTTTGIKQLWGLACTIETPPVISFIRPQQTLREQKQKWSNQDRYIRKLDIVLNPPTRNESRKDEMYSRALAIVLKSAQDESSNPMGESLARCISAIVQQCSGVDISLTVRAHVHPVDFLGGRTDIMRQLKSYSLPNVRKLKLGNHALGEWTTGKDQEFWEICFAGSTFPNLLELDINQSPRARADTLYDAGSAAYSGFRSGALYDLRAKFRLSKTHGFLPFVGLRKMTEITLRHIWPFRAAVLQSLFACENTIPEQLTKLDISFCPGLDQFIHGALFGLVLQKTLPLLQHLRLHLKRLDVPLHEPTDIRYCNAINEHPEMHLCNLVRELGENVKSLDLALPFACSHMFKPLCEDPPPQEDLEWPTISRDPLSTLPQRLLAQGYKYRRLIVWNNVCRNENDWLQMQSLADNQGDMVSWEIIGRDRQFASWHVSGCLRANYHSHDMLKRKLEDWEK